MTPWNIQSLHMPKTNTPEITLGGIMSKSDSYEQICPCGNVGCNWNHSPCPKCGSYYNCDCFPDSNTDNDSENDKRSNER